MQEQLTPAFGDYELIDTGDFEKLERFGRYVTRRPEPQAIWRRTLSEEEWRRAADASFLRDTRSEERGEWRLGPEMPSRWTVDYVYKGMRLRMRLGLTSFKHVGIFPEQAANWNFIYDNCRALASGGPLRWGLRAERRRMRCRTQPLLRALRPQPHPRASCPELRRRAGLRRENRLRPAC